MTRRSEEENLWARRKTPAAGSTPNFQSRQRFAFRFCPWALGVEMPPCFDTPALCYCAGEPSRTWYGDCEMRVKPGQSRFPSAPALKKFGCHGQKLTFSAHSEKAPPHLPHCRSMNPDAPGRRFRRRCVFAPAAPSCDNSAHRVSSKSRCVKFFTLSLLPTFGMSHKATARFEKTTT